MVSSRPIAAFLLIASFGILFAGCSAPDGEDVRADVVFTADDIARSRELADSVKEETELDDEIELRDEGEVISDTVILDVSKNALYSTIRSGPAAVGENVFKVTNDFLNVRSEPRATAEALDRLERGDTFEVIEFVNAAWAHIRLPRGAEGYVAERYIAKLSSESSLAADKEKYKDMYFVDFGFLNVRSAADTHSEKIGEFAGQSFVSVLSKDETWARVPFEGGEGYVAVQYLTPFMPNFIVRQEEFTLPILHFNASGEDVLDALPRQIDAVREAGYDVITASDFRDTLLKQEEEDVRLSPKKMIIAISGITPENRKEVTDVLRASFIRATLFIETRHLGIDGITEKNVLTMVANGHDVQSAGHSNEDLRSMTNAQVELELKQSRKLLEEYTGRQVIAVAYPEGGVNPRIEEKAAEAGYLLGFSSAQDRTFGRNELLRLPSLFPQSDATPEEVLGLLLEE